MIDLQSAYRQVSDLPIPDTDRSSWFITMLKYYKALSPNARPLTPMLALLWAKSKLLRVFLGVAMLLSYLLWPRPAYAACNTFDLTGCLVIAEYNLWNSVAVLLWQIDRMLLQAAYYIDQLRWWMVTQAFQHSYDAVRLAVEPLLTPVASLALTLALIFVLCVPLFGRIDLINIRQVLVWLTLGPMVLLHAGPLLVEVERMRIEVGDTLVTAAGLSLDGIFQPAEQSDEPGMQVKALYEDASICPNAKISRPDGAKSNALRQDDLAAAFVLANAQDIHCPGTQSPDSTLPDRFFDQGAYAFNGDIVSSLDSPELAAAPKRMKLGAVRLALGIVPCLLSVMEMLIQLLFAASLAMMWLLLPMLLIMLFFARDLRALGLLINRVGHIMVTSWVISLLLGMVAVALLAAARSGNASAYVALTLGGGYLIIRMLRVAMETFSEAMVGAGSLLGGTAGAALVGASVALGSQSMQLGGKLLRRGVKHVRGKHAQGQQEHRRNQERGYQEQQRTSVGRIQLATRVGGVESGRVGSGKVGSGKMGSGKVRSGSGESRAEASYFNNISSQKTGSDASAHVVRERRVGSGRVGSGGDTRHKTQDTRQGVETQHFAFGRVESGVETQHFASVHTSNGQDKRHETRDTRKEAETQDFASIHSRPRSQPGANTTRRRVRVRRSYRPAFAGADKVKSSQRRSFRQ